jgi:ketosteroid isomerase-like protein
MTAARATGAPSPDTTGEIAAARDRFIAALQRGDAPGAAEAYTEDARLLAPSAELVAGRSSIARFWQAGIDAGVDSIELHALDVEIEPGGETACEIGHYVLRLTPPSGEGVVDRGRYLLVYRHDPDGTWRRAAETFNPGDVSSREASPRSEHAGVAAPSGTVGAAPLEGRA